MALDFKIGNIKNLDHKITLGIQTHREIMAVAAKLKLPLIQSFKNYYGSIITISPQEFEHLKNEIANLKSAMPDNQYAQDFFEKMLTTIHTASQSKLPIIAHPD